MNMEVVMSEETFKQCEDWNENKQWWEPCKYHPDSEFYEGDGEKVELNWLCDHLGDAQDSLEAMWNVLLQERQAKAELERRLGVAVECLEFADLRFSAMADSTINNGVPSASELIGLSNESTLKIGLCIDEIRAKEGDE